MNAKNAQIRRSAAAARRRDLLENLESRQMMAASFSAAFNFQPGGPGTPAGLTADYGNAFSWQFKQQYGWNTNNRANAVDRKTSANDELDTFNKLGSSGAASTWEVAVPNGTYSVKIVAGDASAYDSKYVIKAENTTVVNGTPTSGSRWVEGTANVTVTDGRLTLTSGSGALNNKINSVRISSATGGTPTTGGSTNPTPTPTPNPTPTPSAGAPAAPTGLTATAIGTSAIALKWNDNATNETGYTFFRSTDGTNFTAIATLPANAKTYTATGQTGGTKYWYKVAANNAAGSTSSAVLAVTSSGKAPTTGGSTGGSTTTAPAAPTGLAYTAIGTTSIGLKWNDNASNESGYTVFRSTNGTTFTAVASLASNTKAYTATGLSANTRYYFQVKANNSAGTTTSNTLSVWTTKAATGGSTDPDPTPVSTPAAPTGVSASTTGTSSIAVSWNDVADDEDGYTVYRSTDNVNFTAVGWLGAGTRSYSATGLNAGTRYYFKVAAYNDAGSASSGSVNATTSSPSTGGSTGGSNADGITNKFAMSGIVQNEVSFKVADKAMKELGITSVRLWYGLNDWNGGLNTNDINRAMQWKNAGYTVTLAVVAKKVTEASTAKAYFDKLMANGTARAAVDYWEIGNEPNHSSFWNSSLQKYVTNYLKPAYEAIKPYGEKVIGGGASYDVNAAAEMEKWGYSKYCDYVGFHPYGESGAIVVQRAKAAQAAFGGKQMIITEWNVQRVTDATKWSKEITIAAQGLQHIAYLNYYYALEYDETHVGKGGAIFSDGRKNTLFWNEIYSWTH